MTEILSGQDLIDAGMRQGKWFRPALCRGQRGAGAGRLAEEACAVAARAFEPPPAIRCMRPAPCPSSATSRPRTPEEAANVEAVARSMAELMRTPVVRAGAIMPDACPAGPPGTIPVGGVVASEAIHPGMHSADICCSMAISVFPGVAPAALLDAVQAVTHFGPGGRPRGQQFRPPQEMLRALRGQPVAARHDQRGDRAFRHAGRRQPFRLCRHDEVERRDGARHPSRLARAGRPALQQGHEDRRRLPQAAVARDAAAERLDSGRHARRARTTGRRCRRSASGPRATTA